MIFHGVRGVAETQLKMNGGVVFGRICLVFLAAIAIFGPFIVPTDPNLQDLAAALQSPGIGHPLGTDHLGRDLLARVVHGAARSLGLAFLCLAMSAFIGIGFGLVSALKGGFTERLIMQAADVMLAMPGLLLAIVLAGLFGGGIVPMLIGINLTLWPQFARMSRSSAASALIEPHVEAARLAGFGEFVIIRRHVLSAVLRHIVALMTLGVGNAILSISALGFLGLGLQPPAAEWGAIIADLLPYASEAPIQLAAPCLLIFATVLSCTLLGEHYTVVGPGTRTHL